MANLILDILSKRVELYWWKYNIMFSLFLFREYLSLKFNNMNFLEHSLNWWFLVLNLIVMNGSYWNEQFANVYVANLFFGIVQFHWHCSFGLINFDWLSV
jgi:hypothetical protein